MFNVYICCTGRRIFSSRNSLLYFGSPLSRRKSSQTATPRDPTERLKDLRTGERIVAVFAGISLILGYFALKKSFSTMAARHYHPQPLVIAGPSGSGKSTLLKRLFIEFPDEFGFSVSHTSRKPRPGEKNGREYHFTTKEKMQEGIDRGDFIETAEYSGNMYGTSKKSVSDVQAQCKVCVLDIDMQGVRSMKETDLNPLYVFIQPPSLQELEKRLVGRETDTKEAIQNRLQIAKEEMEFAATPGVFDHVIVNDNIDRAYGDLRNIVFKEVESIRKNKEISKI